MEARLAELEAERAAEHRPRPVLRGKAVPGNAWTSYGDAIRSDTLQPSAKVPQYLEGSGGSTSLTELLGWASAASGPLVTLRAGTQRAEVRPTLDFNHRFTPRVDDLVDPSGAWRDGTRNLPLAAAVLARGLLDEGKGAQAAEMLLDLCQFGRDTFENGAWETERVGVWVLDLMARELRDAVKTRKLAPEVLLNIDRELAILEEGWPDGRPALRNHVLAFGRGCEQEAAEGSLWYQNGGQRSLHTWRFGYSSRLRAAATFLRADGWYRGLEGESLWAWPDPVLSDALDNRFDYLKGAPRTRLGLVRIAAHFRATGEVLSLRDPFGDRLKTALTADRLRVWSVGWNHADDGGNGDWSERGKDVVLEVER
jgi:hypothetical protein